MSIDLESLAKKFQNYRARHPGKKVKYPLKLRKAATGLVTDLPQKTVAEELGVSQASMRVWSKRFSSREPNLKDIIPLEITPEVALPGKETEEVAVKIVCLEVKIPTSRIKETLQDVLRGMGGASC